MILGETQKGLQGDVIEAIIALPHELFYGTPIPGCVIVLNRNKPVNRKNKIIFIYAAMAYEEGKTRNKLRDIDIERITSAFMDFKDVERYCHVADFDEIRENEFNLNVPRYVDISEPEEEIDIQETIDKMIKLDTESSVIEERLKSDLKELRFRV